MIDGWDGINIDGGGWDSGGWDSGGDSGGSTGGWDSGGWDSGGWDSGGGGWDSYSPVSEPDSPGWYAPALGDIWQRENIVPVPGQGTAPDLPREPGIWREPRIWRCRDLPGGEIQCGFEEFTPEGPSGERPPEENGDQPDRLERIADIVSRAWGGGGIVVPPPTPPTVAVAPATRQQSNVVAILLILAGVGVVGFYLYAKSREKKG